MFRPARKRIVDLGPKMLMNKADEVIDIIKETVSPESDISDVTILLEASYKRAKIERDAIDAENRIVAVLDQNFANEDYGDENVNFFNELNESATISGLVKKCPNKYNIYTKQEKQYVVNIMGEVRSQIASRINKSVDLRIAENTVALVKSKPGFAVLDPNVIVGWEKNMFNVHKKRGRPVNEEFERDVWGNLMICILRKSNNVSV